MQDKEILDNLRAEDNLRQLVTTKSRGRILEYEGRQYVNLSSNDYLGLSGNTGLQKEFAASLDWDHFLLGNPSSRLLTGNSPHYDALEATIGGLYNRSALVLSSGFMVNTGVLPALTSRGDLVLADKLVHASIIDGMRLCECEWMRFNHNDTEHLESLLKKAAGKHETVWVVAESLYSMDGDYAPLAELVRLKEKYGFRIYLDEAHAFAVCGPGGLGLAEKLGYLPQIDILIATLGKAVSSCGAFVVCRKTTRELLVNRMRTLIFSTAIPPVNLMWSAFLLRRMDSFSPMREHLRELVERLTGNRETSHIVPMMAGTNAQALEMAGKLREAGFWTTAIRYPAVPQGKARIRLSLNAALTIDDIDKFKEACSSIG